MKFNFKIQPYQTDAVNAVVRVFTGQKFQQNHTYRREVNAKASEQTQTSFMADEFGETLDAASDIGYNNALIKLTDDQLLQNIQRLQQENNIREDTALVKKLGRVNLDVEMETGTGKTYVYIKTMFELNKQYGWSKFIVVVPSIAIREGVYKSFEYTAEHFMQHYKKKARFFIYNSSNLNQLDTFSSSAGINVMIINTQAFAASMNEDKNVEGRKGDAAARIIYSKRDEFGSRRPIDVIAANNPIIILDEPQTLDKDYIQAIVATVQSVEETSNSVQAAQERIGGIVNDLERTIELLKRFKERLDRLSHLENIDKIWEKTEAHEAEISELIQESKHISDEVRKNAEQIAALAAYVASVSTIEHLGDVDSLWDSSQLHTAQIQGLQETEEQTQSLIQTNREDMNHALAAVDEAAKTAIQELNKKINYAYMIAGGSVALALIEMLIIFLR